MFFNTMLLLIGSIVAITAVVWSLGPVRMTNPFYI